MLVDVTYRSSGGQEGKAKLAIGPVEGLGFSIEFRSADFQCDAQAEDYFEALCVLRRLLEASQIELIVNGSSRDVFPSGMARDMSDGQKAYRLRIGEHASVDDLADIFDLDRSKYRTSTVDEQYQYYESWLSSQKKRRFLQPPSIESIDQHGGDYLFFWGHRPKYDGVIDKSCLSQWWPCTFRKDGVVYFSAEQWMMAEKARVFFDEVAERRIVNTKSPREAKSFGRQVLDFNQRVWDLKAYSIVVEGNFLKFSQNADLKAFLLNTDRSILVEASPVDPIWGVGLAESDPAILEPSSWKGRNQLGFALMEVRSRLLQRKRAQA